MISLGFVNGPQLAKPFIRHADDLSWAEIGTAFETTFFAQSNALRLKVGQVLK